MGSPSTRSIASSNSFDLKNIPNYDLLLYAARKQLITMTPPVKAYLEEKLLFALFHHPVLAEFWKQEFGGKERSGPAASNTGNLDTGPAPAAAASRRARTEHCQATGNELGSTQGLGPIRPAAGYQAFGFSATAWGSRGVTIGHDHPESEWDAAVQSALDAFETTPHVLQKFHHGNRYGTRYYDFAKDAVRKMNGRVRLSPYYFVANDETTLAGILVTIGRRTRNLSMVWLTP